jgi:hypothetical protein
MDDTTILTAKIAAESAADSAMIAATAAIIGALIGATVSIFAAAVNSKTAKKVGTINAGELEKRRFIDTVSTERIKWINEVRDKFAQYNKIVFIMGKETAVIKLTRQEGKGYKESLDLNKSYDELIYYENLIDLFLNPIEKETKVIKKHMKMLRDNITEYKRNFDPDEFENAFENLLYAQQVILKAEWKRLKEEAKKGEELSDEDAKKLAEYYAKEIKKEYNEMKVNV